MTPAHRERLQKCLALAEHGATAGERAAGLAAAARIAAGAGLTLAEMIGTIRQPRGASSRPPPRRSYAWAQPKPAVEPITIEELLRQKAETEAWRKRAATATARRRRRERAKEDAYAAEQRDRQAERDRDWARARAPATDDAP